MRFSWHLIRHVPKAEVMPGLVATLSQLCSSAVLQEDVSVTERRTAVRELYDKIKMGIDDVQYKQEKVKRKDHEGDNVSAKRIAGLVCMQLRIAAG